LEKPAPLAGRKALLGVTGSIAAYKAVEILRRLKDCGVETTVAMTRHAAAFVSPLTFETLSGRPVLLDDLAERTPAAIGHIAVTEDLDFCLVAPATANIIGKIAAGIADDALTSALMALDCPLVIAPAMNDRMYRNPVLRKNIDALAAIGVKFIEPETGELACGMSGKGRLADVDSVLRTLSSLFLPQELAGVKVLVTAGPTREAIDPVRFIGNPSTGKMGYALASAAMERGAEVVLVSGPVELAAPRGAAMVRVVSAGEMRAAVMENAAASDIVIMAAAVSDFAPSSVAGLKIKKEDAPLILHLERTPDILSELGKSGGGKFLVGFAAETHDVEKNALQKLRDKKLDMIVANDLLMEGSGFGKDTNAVIILSCAGDKTELPRMLKSDAARHIIAAVIEQRGRKTRKPSPVF
jgi:phosphopantothenoylcysteine decarboxylase / phosphopantothenate---cysteine ligase